VTCPFLSHHLLRLPQAPSPGNDEVFGISTSLGSTACGSILMRDTALPFTVTVIIPPPTEAPSVFSQSLPASAFLLHLLSLLHQIAHSTSHDYLLK
jgi:hypothetical protein